MKVLYLRTNDYKFDSRVKKEIESICKLDDVELSCFGWYRDGEGTKTVSKTLLDVHGKQIPLYLADVYGPWGRGGRKNFVPLFVFMRVLKKWFKKHAKEFDAVHCVDLGTAYYVIPVAKKLGIKIIYDIFDYFADVRKYPKPVSNFFKRKETKLINKADVTIICSDERINQISPAKPKQLEIIHNSPDIDAFAFKKNINNNEQITFGYFGNLVNDRLIDLILKYFADNGSYKLLIGGIGALSELAKEYSEKHSNISFFGPLEYSRVLELENQCDVLFALYDPSVPNHRFVASNKFYETIALGKQIIMCKNTGMDSMVISNKAGVLVDPTIEGLQDGIGQLIVDKKNWNYKATFEKESFMENYSWKIMENKIHRIYKSILEK